MIQAGEEGKNARGSSVFKSFNHSFAITPSLMEKYVSPKITASIIPQSSPPFPDFDFQI